MIWLYANPNPANKQVPDCVVRAISIATGKGWKTVYRELCKTGWEEFDMPSSNAVWGLYLYRNGFEPFLLPEACPQCVTVRAFSQMYPEGTYIIGTGSHAVAVVNGDYFDSWDSGGEVPSYFWAKKGKVN